MKHTILTALMLTAATVLMVPETQAQGLEAGIRIGDNVAADLTTPLSTAPRLHGAVYFDRFGVGTYFDWLFRLGDGPGNLRFYPGIGPELFFENQFDLRVAGNFGLEWAFSEVPLSVGFDWRPAFRFTNGSDFNSGNWGFTVRFRLGEGNFEPAN